MEASQLFKIFLLLHIAMGSVALTLGTLIIILKKGDNRHRLLGKIFYYAMTLNALFSFYLAVYHPNQFLFIVGIFSLYLVQSGYRILKHKKGPSTVTLFDWTLTIAMMVFGTGFVALAVYDFTRHNYFGFAPLVFGLIGLRLAYSDYKFYTGKIKEKNYWLVMHIAKMTASFIAATTAFIVVNNSASAMYLNLAGWLMPTVVGSVLIFSWIGKYRPQKELPFKLG